jgi:hypothetical protein
MTFLAALGCIVLVGGCLQDRQEQSRQREEAEAKRLLAQAEKERQIDPLAFLNTLASADRILVFNGVSQEPVDEEEAEWRRQNAKPFKLLGYTVAEQPLPLSIDDEMWLRQHFRDVSSFKERVFLDSYLQKFFVPEFAIQWRCGQQVYHAFFRGQGMIVSGPALNKQFKMNVKGAKQLVDLVERCRKNASSATP